MPKRKRLEAEPHQVGKGEYSGAREGGLQNARRKGKRLCRPPVSVDKARIVRLVFFEEVSWCNHHVHDPW